MPCLHRVDKADLQEQTKLTVPDGVGGDMFGVYVSLSGLYCLIGADGDDGWSDAAYVFKREGTAWMERAKLKASNSDGGDRFGLCVSVSGDYALGGVPYADPHGQRSGAAYVFKRYGENWIEQAELTAFDGASYAYFSVSSALSVANTR